jgi:hypothetical protein
MERCPDKETLERFVEYELNEEMNAKILEHLSVCEGCRQKLNCMLTEDQGVIKALLTEPTHRKQAVTVFSDRCLPKAAILAYNSKCLNEDQLKLVESHLQKCDNCMFELLRLQRAIHSTAEIDLNMSALKAVTDLGMHILEVVLKVKDNLIDLIRHNGELLPLTPQLSSVRGKEESEKRPIVIRKDFQERDLSVEMTIKREIKESGATVSISVMKLSNEEFLSGIDVELSGQEMHKKQTTEDGVAEFYGIKTGTYSIKLAGADTAWITIE